MSSRLRGAVTRTRDAKVTRPVAQLAKLDLNLLVILREPIRERDVTRAAERVAVTQPAASAALARLRRHFGVELLVRRGGDYLLSPLAGEAEELIRRIDGIVSPPLTALMVPHVRSTELFRDRWVCVCWNGNSAR